LNVRGIVHNPRVMRHETTILAALAALAIGAAGCGTTTRGDAPSETDTATAGAEDPGWTARLIRKLDRDLRERVRSASAGRVAVKVFFTDVPDDTVLSELLLNRVGNQAVGEIPADQLRRIAARDDVTRIETLSGVGY
jgi:hypothetical protein